MGLGNPKQAFAQRFELTGTVIDASTKETLPAANISIEGTYSGTITNSDGQFVLPVKQFPITLVIRYIGYETQRITVNENPREPLEIRLKAIAYELENVEVTGEDPAVYIMRQVIEKKKQWRKLLKTYKAEAYTRQRLENDTGIVSINESISMAYWHFENGAKEVIKSKRQTNNMSAANNFAGASYVPNFYDDDITISGFKMMGVTHPKAIETYAFKLEGYRMLDEKVVFDISVKPKSKLESAFKGKIAILDEDYALLEVDLVPSESMLFPPPIKEFNLYYKQQFNNFGGDFWLPVDVRIQGTISIAMMGLQIPKINFHQISKLSEYDVNIPLPDSLYGYRRLFIVDSLSVAQSSDSLFALRADVIPLSGKESSAYKQIDSTMTLEKAFKPTGFLAKMLEDDEDNPESSNSGFGGKLFNYVTPEIWYNRAEGAHVGGDVHYSTNGFKAGIRGGYKTEVQGWGYGSYLSYSGRQKGRVEAKLFFNDDAQTRFSSPQYNRLFSSATFLFSGRDYFDYYWSKQFGAEASYEFRIVQARRRRDRVDMKVGLGFLSDASRSISKKTDYDVFGNTRLERPNPNIPSLTINSLKAFVQLGDDFVPFSPIGQSRAKLSIEHASSGIFASDVDFSTYQLEMDYRLNTFFRRRFLPQALDMRFVAGTSSGNLPLQRLFTLDGSLGGFSPFGTFRSLQTSYYEGNHYLAFHWEHNFRTVPFELLGWSSLAKKGTSLIVFGSHGKTWMNADVKSQLGTYARILNGTHHELGASISGIFDFLRIDFIQRIDRPNFYIGLSVARIL